MLRALERFMPRAYAELQRLHVELDRKLSNGLAQRQL